MPLPEFNKEGDLPVGIYRATLHEVIDRFGSGTPERRDATARLLRVIKDAQATRKLDRVVIFGG